jgi:hypothetical protein
MKKITIICISILFGVQIWSQTPIKDQPGQTYFDMLEKIIIEKTISEKELLALKPYPLPENFMDTLKKHDWAYVGGYFYTEKKYTSYQNLYKEYKIMRFDENGGKVEFSINGYQNYVINSLNLKNPPRSQWSVIKNPNSWYIEQKLPDGKEYQKILSYKNGVLVYVISKSGKLTDNTVYFREVYVAVPKGFNWSFNE